MAWTTPGTAVAGDVLTASFWNQQVRDNMEFVAGAPFARNILYNGAMQVAQRGTSTAGITSALYGAADRWAAQSPGAFNGSWTQSVENDAPTGSGFRKSSKMLIPTAANPTASQGVQFAQALEGQDLQRVAKGTSSAQTLTISFWVKSNATGTFICELYDIDNTRSVSKSYSISSSATWEYKTITFPADTSGAFDNDNAASLSVVFWLTAGTNYTSGTLNTSWNSVTSANRAVGQTNLAATNGNYWQVTGVQLEVGSAATGFEFLPFGDELRRCERYYQRWQANATNLYPNIGVGFTTSTSGGQVMIPLHCAMRATPTLPDWGTLRLYDSSVAQAVTGATLNTDFSTAAVAHVGVVCNVGVTANRPALLQGNNSASAFLALSAEL